jgi:DUF4097 and DUF4098 domain-containing protein YvlB
MKKTILIVLAALLVIPAVAAARTVDETRSASPGGVVAIEVLSGDISIIGWDRSEVNVTGTIDDELYELKIKESEQRTTISVEPRGNKLELEDGDVDLEIRVPSGGRLEAETLSAGVTVEAVSGAVTIESISGMVRVEGAVPEAEVSTVSGTIVISSSAELQEGEFQSVSGSIKLKGMLSADGDFAFETVSGNIELHLPAGTSAEFEVETFNGDIKNDFGPAAEKTSKYLPAKSLEFSIGGGGASVSVTSINGSVKLVQD